MFARKYTRPCAQNSLSICSQRRIKFCPGRRERKEKNNIISKWNEDGTDSQAARTAQMIGCTHSMPQQCLLLFHPS